MDITLRVPRSQWSVIVNAHRWRDKDGHQLTIQGFHGEKPGWLMSWCLPTFIRQV